MESPHAAAWEAAQTPPAANATRHPERIDPSSVPLGAAASAGGEVTRVKFVAHVSKPLSCPAGTRRGGKRMSAAAWFTAIMSRTVADVLRDALVDADRHESRSPTLDRLSDSDVQLLAAETLAFLRTRPFTESPIPGWRRVSNFHAGVNPWWNQQIGSPISGDPATRLQKLRAQIYDYLDEQLRLISKARGQTAPVHLSPVGEVLSPEQADDAPRKIFVGSSGAGFGDPGKNRIVELAAMHNVVEFFEGWQHEDVSPKNLGWDISFTRGTEERHVEVKGVSGRRPSVLLTRNEMEKAASDPLWSLAVVTQALVAPAVHTFGRDEVLGTASPYVFRAEFDPS